MSILKIFVILLYILIIIMTGMLFFTNEDSNNSEPKTNYIIKKEVTKILDNPNIQKKIANIKEENLLQQKSIKINHTIEFNISKNLLKGYILNKLSVKEYEKVDFEIKKISKLFIKKYSLKEKTNVQDLFVLNEMLKGAIIHTKLVNSNLFKGKSFEENVLVRFIVLYVIANRETSYFNYDPYIFSRTLAWGMFQVNGNTLGFNFNNFLKSINISAKDVINKNYRVRIHNDKYDKYVNDYKNKKTLSKLLKIEYPYIKNQSMKLFETLKVFKIQNGKYSELMSKRLKSKKYKIYYNKKLSNIRSEYYANISTFLRRVLYGIDYNGNSFFLNKNPKISRLMKIQMSASFSEIYIKNQGFFSLLVFENKHKQIKEDRTISLSSSYKNIRELILNVSKRYNGGKHKLFYGLMASKDAGDIFYKIKMEFLKNVGT